MSHFVNCPLSPLLCYSLKIRNYEKEKRRFSSISYMACPACHIISREVENQIFRHNCIFRCTCIYKQPKMTKLWNYNILSFIQLSYKYNNRLFDVFFLLLTALLSGFHKKQIRKINLQKKVHRKICVKDITFLAACPPFYVIFLPLFFSTQILHRKKRFCSRKCWAMGDNVLPPVSANLK